MKKHQYLPIVLVAIILLLCACARQVTDPPETIPSGSSSAALQSKPTTKPTTAPTTKPTTAPTAKPTTAPTTKPTTAPTKPTTAPTQPTLPPEPIQLHTDWVTNREIVPFEDRFKEDVPFGSNSGTWLVPEGDGYLCYRLSKKSPNNPLWVAVLLDRSGRKEVVYEIPAQQDLTAFSLLATDGRWCYLRSDDALIRMDLLSGEITTLAEKSEDDIRWEVSACGRDTVCIFRLDGEKTLRVFYRDLHSDAERTLYEGVFPEVPTDERQLVFYRPSTTQGQAYWQMRNPAFEEVFRREAADPDSPCKGTGEVFDIAVQDYYDIPILVQYYCDFHTGTLTADFGIMDSCWYGTSWGHNHFDYEITRSEPTVILSEEPIAVPNLIKLTPEQAEAAAALNKEFHYNSFYEYRYSEFGHYLPYLLQDGIYTKLSDIPITSMVVTPDFVYCITTEQTIIQLSRDGSICNTIYTAEKDLGDLFYWRGSLYFTDGSTFFRINTITGMMCPILGTTLKEVYIIGEYMDGLYLGVRQGLYCQEYRFYPDIGVLEKESYI